MADLVCTYCSGPKREDGGLLPAVDRYLGERIGRLSREAAAAGREFRILSGEFGLLAPDRLIPWYDHLLQPDEAEGLAEAVAIELERLGPDRILYHTADPERVAAVAPYLAVIRQAARLARIDLEIYLLPGDPD